MKNGFSKSGSSVTEITAMQSLIAGVDLSYKFIMCGLKESTSASALLGYVKV